MIHKPVENAAIMEYPCNRKNCKLYKEWGIDPFVKRKVGYTIETFKIHGNDACLCCKHFEGFDLEVI